MLLAALACAESQPERLARSTSFASLQSALAPGADARKSYGTGPSQFGYLQVPTGPGPHPVAIFLHGGCWLAQYSIGHSNKLTGALAARGIASWSLEYRRVGEPGGGWPGTFEDVATGADHLRSISDAHHLDLTRVIAVGHSAGGQLALWLAARKSLPAQAPGYATNPIPVQGVLGLAPAADLAALHRNRVCGHVVDQLMGGSPRKFATRYQWMDPARFDALDVPQIVVVGARDADWTPVARRYAKAARKRGDDLTLIEAPDSGHFEMIDPGTTSWPLVLNAARDLLDGSATPE